MNAPHHFQLINGTFTPAEASQILLSLVKNKIDYHSREKFSDRERHGKDPALSAKRLQELTALQDSLNRFLASAAESGLALEINCRIEITVA